MNKSPQEISKFLSLRISSGIPSRLRPYLTRLLAQPVNPVGKVVGEWPLLLYIGQRHNLPSLRLDVFDLEDEAPVDPHEGALEGFPLTQFCTSVKSIGEAEFVFLLLLDLFFGWKSRPELPHQSRGVSHSKFVACVSPQARYMLCVYPVDCEVFPHLHANWVFLSVIRWFPFL